MGFFHGCVLVAASTRSGSWRDSLTPKSVLHEVSRELALEAARLAGTFKLRGCDAVYVALAKSLGERLLTFDAEQRERSLATLRP